ncbi:cupin domain-containing protein [Sphingobium sp. AN641]|uniref:cupin domain-containing protein n=1 Tax=Sphingobium sp. AN641 TaxID=3133443 RepID=UPI0030BB14E7
MHFNDFDIGVFLRDYWQKRPLLIRKPWSEWRNPVDPDELAGLACEPGVEARLITQDRIAFGVEHGPIPEARFSKLGRKPWTLLVQSVDQHVADVAALIAPFRFIPNWRIDDVMVSYATDGGGVGPHFDHYDVFLIQGLGQRRWQLGGACDADTPLLPHDDLRLLAHFEPAQDWVLDPGDILYVPPRIAHNGVAVGDDCMTYSIGFRAPARSELVADWCDHLVAGLQDEDRYADPDLQAQDNPGEISIGAVERLHAMVTETMGDPDGFARWFGRYNSMPKQPDIDWRPDEPIDMADVRNQFAGGAALCRNPASRFSFIREGALSVRLFVDGCDFPCDGPSRWFAERLCARERMMVDADLIGSDAVMMLVAALYNLGSVAFDAEE